MKKLHYFLFAAAALTIVSCADEDSMGVGDGMAKSQAINFGFNVPNMLRGDFAGSEAAGKIDNEFVVFGTKHLTGVEDGTAANDQTVYTNYVVTYKDNTAGTTASNTANWEYVDGTPYAEDKVSPAIGTSAKQTIKYWDYSATNGYTFTAFAGKSELTAGNITVKKLTTGDDKYDKGYELTAKPAANLDNVYYSDRVEVAKDKYGQPVTLTFRNFGARVRVGFYSTVKGYDVKINKFYYGADGNEAITKYANMTSTNETNFAAALRSVNSSATAGNTITVKYNDNSVTDVENRPTVTNTTVEYTNTLTLGAGVVNTVLASSAAEPTWDKTKGAYTTVFPNEACTQPMLIRCDYTLTSTDGSNETIEVKNARVVVPTEYMKWKPNFAYTYIFKISDKTNGTTGTMPVDPDNPKDTEDPEGLHPITFDAVVIDATTGKPETVTSIATNSVTTYANGSKVTENGEYKNGETIYIVNENTVSKDVIKPTAIGDGDGEARFVNLDKAATESEVYAQLNGANMGIKLTEVSGAAIVSTIPASDGTKYTLDAVSATPTAAGTYAYIYTTKKYVPAVYTSAAATTYTSTTYYFKTTGDYYYAASGISATNFDKYKDQLYTLTTDATKGVYDIKVITVK